MTEKPLVDRRTCTSALRMSEFRDVLRRSAIPVLPGALGHPLDFWTGVVNQRNQFIHLWGSDDFAGCERRSQTRDSHPSSPAYLSASAHLITAQETRITHAPDMQLHIPSWIFQ